MAHLKKMTTKFKIHFSQKCDPILAIYYELDLYPHIRAIKRRCNWQTKCTDVF